MVHPLVVLVKMILMAGEWPLSFRNLQRRTKLFGSPVTDAQTETMGPQLSEISGNLLGRWDAHNLGDCPAATLAAHVPFVGVPALGRAEVPRADVHEAIGDDRRVDLPEQVHDDHAIGEVVDDLAEDAIPLLLGDRRVEPIEQPLQLGVGIPGPVTSAVAVLGGADLRSLDLPRR